MNKIPPRKVWNIDPQDDSLEAREITAELERRGDMFLSREEMDWLTERRVWREYLMRDRNNDL